MTRDDERTVHALRGLADRQEVRGPVPVAELLHRGRRARRLRTVTRAVAGAGCLVLAVGVLLTVRPGGPESLPVPPAGPTQSAVPTPVSDEVLLTVLKTVLPAGSFSEVPGAGGATAGRRLAVRFDDGTGAGLVSVLLQRRAGQLSPEAPELSCPDPKIDPYDACRTSTLTDGSVLRTLRTPLYGMGRDGYTEASVVISRKDGRLITLKASNATVAKDVPLTRTTPPLTTDQLTAAATADGWDAAMAGVPVSAGQSRRSGIPGRQIVDTAAGLLPAGLVPADPGTADPGTGDLGYANFTVRDGQGPSLVEIVLQDRRGDLANGFTADGGWQTLPDGTRVRDHREAAEPDGWVAEALRPDGLWVMVVAYNSDRLKQPATRQKPVLTTEQMRALAASPAWRLPG